MPAPVARDEYDGLPVERAEAELVRGRAERAVDPPPFDIGEPVDLVEPAAADDADDRPGSCAPQWTGAQILRLAA